MLVRMFKQIRMIARKNPGNAARGCLAVSPHVRISSEGDGMTLLDVARGMVFTCNRTGRLIWQGLTSGQSLASIATGLSREYGLPEDQAAQDVTAFVSELRAGGLLVNGGGN